MDFEKQYWNLAKSYSAGDYSSRDPLLDLLEEHNYNSCHQEEIDLLREFPNTDPKWSKKLAFGELIVPDAIGDNVEQFLIFLKVPRRKKITSELEVNLSDAPLKVKTCGGERFDNGIIPDYIVSYDDVNEKYYPPCFNWCYRGFLAYYHDVRLRRHIFECFYILQADRVTDMFFETLFINNGYPDLFSVLKQSSIDAYAPGGMFYEKENKK